MVTPRIFFPRDFLHHRRRVAEIVAVLSRHGLGWLLDQLGFGTLAVRERGRLRAPRLDHRASGAVHLRMALEELGPTFIKIGQVLSTREDLLPAEYISELARLRDRVPPVPTEAVVQEIERTFGRPLADLFCEFDPEPLASASIGQVHAARLRIGTTVVVKVRKPGIAEAIEEDLAILAQLARVAQRRAPLAEYYDLVGLVDEFAWTIRAELDYRREGRNADKLREQFSGNPDIVIPRVIWERTAESVLTLKRIDGIPIDDVAALDRAGIDRPALAQRAARVVLDAILLHGFFHADPHPGNFAVLPDGRIVAYDFGMVGRLDSHTRDSLLEALVGVIRQEPDRVIDALIRLNIIRHESERAGLRRDLQHLIDRYYGMALGEYRLHEVVGDLLTIMRRRRLVLPTELMLVLKTLMMHEGVGRHLNRTFSPSPSPSHTSGASCSSDICLRTGSPGSPRRPTTASACSPSYPGASTGCSASSSTRTSR
ncbi:AarF/ABC1/UbiB kinase family protein [Thermomicrobiaceae bacterium CFH 74404]|uniref:AarF/ABC1/UbiB kinase family protein n=1 Tax=Thermalbibacter longus TaxID=2951981 RepID=A0AA41WCG7_9BACT|nr:AarF/ABC1/UbiB kinase family protein [Thermalbibacter longus]MCM8750536.1 AarF/ABC1/UbiB kinase family protein [Thermalbibacter longus]